MMSTYKSTIRSLTFVPLEGILFVLIATYGAGFSNGYTISEIHDKDISLLGYKRTNSYWWLFSAGFIMASLCIMYCSLLKHWLMDKLSRSYSYCIVISFIIGASGIILMAIIPLTSSMHIISALIGMIFLIIGQIADTLHWWQYRKNIVLKFKWYDYGLILYGLACPLLSFSLFLIWVLTTPDAMRNPHWKFLFFSHSHFEWVGFWLLISGFVTQSAHAVLLKVHYLGFRRIRSRTASVSAILEGFLLIF